LKQIRALSTKNYSRISLKETNPSTPHALATQRRNTKQQERNGSLAKGKAVVYTRDVQIVNTGIGVVSIGVKRSSINHAKKQLAKLIFRGASPRKIERAHRRLEFMISAEQTRKKREAEKNKAAEQ
jgi:hypothetical protein